MSTQHEISYWTLHIIFLSFPIFMGHSVVLSPPPLTPSTLIHITQTILKFFLVSHETMAFNLPISLAPIGVFIKMHGTFQWYTWEYSLSLPTIDYYQLEKIRLIITNTLASEKGCHRNKVLDLILPLPNLYWPKTKRGQRARTQTSPQTSRLGHKEVHIGVRSEYGEANNNMQLNISIPLFSPQGFVFICVFLKLRYSQRLSLASLY